MKETIFFKTIYFAIVENFVNFKTDLALYAQECQTVTGYRKVFRIHEKDPLKYRELFIVLRYSVKSDM